MLQKAGFAVRLAAVDIGSNSVRCTIVDVPVAGPRTTFDDEKAYTRLGRGTLGSGRLSDEAMDETLAALRRMLSIAAEYEVTHVRAVATAAVRGATNGERFVARIHDELGLQVEIISEEHEGRLAFLSASESVDMSGHAAVVDIGGGSVEIVRAEGGRIASVTSSPLGAIVMSERFHASDPMPREAHEALTDHVRGTLAGTPDVSAPALDVLVGSGGTVTTAAAIIAAASDPGLVNVHGYHIPRPELVQLRTRLVGSSAKQRTAMKGMSESRIDLIVAGVVVLDEIVGALGASRLIVNARGMREGIVIETVEHERGASTAFDRMRSVRELVRKFGAGVPHSEQVCRLSLELFDGLAATLDLDAHERPLLEAAALLHDVGYHISYEQHHKHSFQLITHSELPGFNASERRIIAGIARYHKGSLPKGKHEAMQGLSDNDRATVSRLAALLRLGDGLDRSGGQRVVTLDVEPGSDTVMLRIRGRAQLDVEVYGAERKADLFEQVWGKRVRVVEETADARSHRAL